MKKIFEIFAESSIHTNPETATTYRNWLVLQKEFQRQNSAQNGHPDMKEKWEQYHTYYREMRKNWGQNRPIIPVLEFIMEKGSGGITPLLIGDFGCGDCPIQSFITKNNLTNLTVTNIDLQPTDESLKSFKLIAASYTDLSKHFDGSTFDIVVFCLSLCISTDWGDGIREASRVLKSDGFIAIVCTEKEFPEIEAVLQGYFHDIMTKVTSYGRFVTAKKGKHSCSSVLSNMIIDF